LRQVFFELLFGSAVNIGITVLYQIIVVIATDSWSSWSVL